MSRVGTYILTYNRVALLRDCIAAVLAQTEPPDLIVVLDNGSTDGTREAYLAGALGSDPRLHYYRLERNVGPAGGYDILFRLGYARGHDWLWLMDDDIIPAPDALARLLEAYEENFAQPEELGFLQSVATAGDGTPANVPQVDVRAPPHQCPSWADRLDRGLVKLRWATLNSILIPRSTLTRVGGLSADFYFAGEDIDFTLRTTDVLPGYLVGKSRIQHLRAANGVFSVVTQPGDPARLRLGWYYYRNNVYLRRRYYERGRVALFLARCLWEAAASLGARDLRLKRAATILGGVGAGLLFAPTFRPLEAPPQPMPVLLERPVGAGSPPAAALPRSGIFCG